MQSVQSSHSVVSDSLRPHRLQHVWTYPTISKKGFPRRFNGKEPTSQCWKQRQGFDPWVGKIPCSRKWQPTPICLPGEFHGQRGQAGCNPPGHKQLDTTQHTHKHLKYYFTVLSVFKDENTLFTVKFFFLLKYYKSSVFYTCSPSQSRLVTFQVFKGHIQLVAIYWTEQL